jgi:hypothetical protein
MAKRDRTSQKHLEEARELVWDALEKLEEAQRVLFKAGDCYVAQVWGDGVRAILHVTEKITDVSGDLTAAQSEIGRLAKTDRERAE